MRHSFTFDRATGDRLQSLQRHYARQHRLDLSINQILRRAVHELHHGLKLAGEPTEQEDEHMRDCWNALKRGETLTRPALERFADIAVRYTGPLSEEALKRRQDAADEAIRKADPVVLAEAWRLLEAEEAANGD